MNTWADLHGESHSDFDPDPEPNPNGEWYCPKCSGTRWTWRSGDDYQFCVRCNKPMIWKPEIYSADLIWCEFCETHVERKDLKRWTGDDKLHRLCPGCDSDLLEPESME